MPHADDIRPFDVEEVRPPVAVGADGWDAFVALTDVVNRAQSHDLGHDAFIWLPEELIADYADVAHVRKRLFAARADGRIVGRGLLTTWLNDPTTSDVAVSVLPSTGAAGSAGPCGSASSGSPSTTAAGRSRAPRFTAPRRTDPPSPHPRG